MAHAYSHLYDIPATGLRFNNTPEQLSRVVLEGKLGRTGTKEMLPMQPGDVPATYADIDDLARDIRFKPATTIEDGIERFVNWYREYHKV